MRPSCVDRFSRRLDVRGCAAPKLLWPRKLVMFAEEPRRARLQQCLLLLSACASSFCNVVVQRDCAAAPMRRSLCRGARAYERKLLQLRGGGEWRTTQKFGLQGTHGRHVRGKRCLADVTWLPDSCAESMVLREEGQEIDACPRVLVDGRRCLKARRHSAASDFGGSETLHDDADLEDAKMRRIAALNDSMDSDPLIQTADCGIFHCNQKLLYPFPIYFVVSNLPYHTDYTSCHISWRGRAALQRL